MKRIDGRKANELREIKIKRDYIEYAEGSVLIEVGKTKLICAASVEDRVPQFLRGSGSGWITAEYSMLPRSTPVRTFRDSTIGRVKGRTHEIQRLIGRSLRAVVDLDRIGDRTIWIDCDVIQADGGTRTAAITGACIALYDCLNKMVSQGKIIDLPIVDFVGATSVGLVNGEILLDLCFEEDNKAQADMNVVITSKGEIVEIQVTAEDKPLSKDIFQKMLKVAEEGIKKIIDIQSDLIGKDIDKLKK